MTPGLDHRTTSSSTVAAVSRGVVATPLPIPLVLGFGNVLLADDGAGVHLMAALRAELATSAYAVECVDGGTLSFSLLPYVEATDSLLIVDAANLQLSAGAVQLFEGVAMDELLKSSRRRSVHEVGLIDLLDMARVQGSLPERRALLCIQPGVIDWGEMLSPPVSAALPEAKRLALELLCRWRSE